MGFWDFFRKKKEEVKRESLRGEELQEWINKEKKAVRLKEENFRKEINNELEILIKNLELQKKVLEEFDVNTKKAEQRVKFIVQENLSHYVNHLSRLISRLKEIEQEIPDLDRINIAFSVFEKKSSLSYQKATILVGKEIEGLRECIRAFFRNIKNLTKENQEFFEKSKKINSVEKRAQEYSECKIKKKQIEEVMNSCFLKISQFDKERLLKEKEIKSIKKSEKFLETERERKELEREKQRLESLLIELKSYVDFKKLANFYHSFEKEMSTVKNYRQDFRNYFEKTRGEDLILLLEETKMIDQDIKEKIKKINELRDKIKNQRIPDLGISNLEKEIQEVISRMKEVERKMSAEEKKEAKANEELISIKTLLKEELGSLGVELEF